MLQQNHNMSALIFHVCPRDFNWIGLLCIAKINWGTEFGELLPKTHNCNGMLVVRCFGNERGWISWLNKALYSLLLSLLSLPRLCHVVAAVFCSTIHYNPGPLFITSPLTGFRAQMLGAPEKAQASSHPSASPLTPTTSASDFGYSSSSPPSLISLSFTPPPTSLLLCWCRGGCVKAHLPSSFARSAWQWASACFCCSFKCLSPELLINNLIRAQGNN